MRKICFILFFLTASSVAFSQQYNEDQLRTMFDSLSKKYKGYNNAVQLNVSNLPLSELISSVALENNLNISIDPSLNQLISYNFYDAQVKDMLVFLYLNFELEYEFVGSIMSVKKRKIQPEAPKIIQPKKLDITYNPANTFLSVDLKNDSLWKVAEEVTRLTGKNFVINPDVRNKSVSAFFQNRPVDQVMKMIGQSNGLVISQEDDYYLVKPDIAELVTGNKSGQPNGYKNQEKGKGNGFDLTKNPLGNLDVSANGADLNELLIAAADETDAHYILYSNLEGKATLEVKDVSFESLMKKLLTGSKYSFSKEGEIYVIGELKQEGIRKSELIRIENRTIESVKTAIPKDLISDLEVIEFVELNGLVVMGSETKIQALRSFISQIDVVVPMVQIDVMILYSSKGTTVETGISAGIGTEATTTSGTVFPGVDVNLGASSINNFLNAISGFGIFNLGQVTENFYISLQALESNNFITIESTPKISTVNGHEATISIGETTYYQETQVNVQTSVTNSGVVQSKTWKSIDANLSVKIKPFVSADEYVTLTIEVEQDDFSGKVDATAPPNMTTQTFQSLVRVKNGELILLGGLEKKKVNESGSGVPILSRIPILKWFFSSRSKAREKSKLHILIRPTVTY